jgi:hypothetical protein
MFARLQSFFFKYLRPLYTHRMAGWLVAALTLAVAVLLSFGQLRAVFGFKTLLVVWGGYLGYWISRGVLRDYNPDLFLEEADVMGFDGISRVRALPVDEHCSIAFAGAVLARAIIVAAVVLALALGA